MKQIKRGALFFYLGWLLCAAIPAMASGPTSAGEDPFPLFPSRCVSFAGQWRAADGDVYVIQQRECGWIKMQKFGGKGNETLTIVPDNRDRPLFQKGGTIRHHWNSSRLGFGQSIETRRVITLADTQITEITTVEQANENLLLLTTYRTTERLKRPGKPERKYSQKQLSRVSGQGLSY